MILIIALAGSLAFAQDTAVDGVPEPVDESSLILFPEDTAAQAEEDELPEETPAPSSVGVGDLVRVLFVLAAVVAVIYLLVYFLKRFSPLAENDEEQIGILATRHLKKETSLHLIEVGNQIFLIGSGTGQVSLISEITDQETIDKLHLDLSGRQTAQPGSSFRNLIRRNFSRESFEGVRQESPDFLRRQRDRLRHLGEEE